MNRKFVYSILTLIEAEYNVFLEELKSCKMSGYPTWIYGAGEGAENVLKRAESVGIKFAGKLVDRELFVPECGYECLEDVIEKGKINLVVAHRGFDRRKLDVAWGGNIGILIDRDCFSGNYEADSEFMTLDFIKEHDKELTNIYNTLADEKSRQTFLAYINQKISMDYRFLKPVKAEVQYFDTELIRLGDNEALVDAGAYIGDTAESFLKELSKRGIKKYDAIYSFEPDSQNYKKLSKCKYKNFYAYCLATSDKKEQVFFHSKGKGSSSGIFEEQSENAICTDTIDHILKGKKVSFIKMDVEGYELSSLKGARQTISSQRPKLAICIYHKRQDLWEIENYIESVVSSYEFYIRVYDETATELVLYALPMEQEWNKDDIIVDGIF